MRGITNPTSSPLLTVLGKLLPTAGRYRNSIFHKILGLALLILALGGVVIVFLRLEVNAYIQRDEARRLNVHLLNAHRFERDFLVSRKQSHGDAFYSSVNALNAIIIQQDKGLENSLRPAVNAYSVSFAHLAQIMSQRGLNENVGAEGTFRKSVHAIEKIVGDAGQLELMNLLLQTRRYEKDFIMRRQTKYIDNVKKSLVALRTRTQQTSLPVSTKNAIDSLSRSYEENFTLLVNLFTAIDRYDGQLQHEFTDIDKAIGLIVAAKEQAAMRYRMASLLVLILSFVVGVGLAIRMARNISRPLVRLTKAVEHVAEGNFHELTQPNSQDEIGRLTTSFNIMVGNIRSSNQALQDEKISVEVV